VGQQRFFPDRRAQRSREQVHRAWENSSVEARKQHDLKQHDSAWNASSPDDVDRELSEDDLAGAKSPKR
jgi:hypothetical protein